MNSWSAIVVIVAIVAVAAMRIVRYASGWGDGRSRRGMVGAPIIDALSSRRESELQKEVEDLRARIAVLERIATEDRHGKSIAAEIESLRDK